MINHADAERLIATAIDFPLSAADRQRLDEHLRSCSRCTALQARLRADARALSHLEPISAPVTVRRAVVEGTADSRRGAGRPFVLLAAAALLVVLTTGAVVMGSQLLDLRERSDLIDASASPTPSASPSASASPNVTALRPGEMARVLVADLPMRIAGDGPGDLLESALAAGELLYVFGGPALVDGEPWYGVQSRDGNFAWIPAASGSEPSLAVASPACPAGDVDAASLHGMHPAERLLCLGAQDLTLRVWIPVSGGLGGLPGYEAQPEWLAQPFAIEVASVSQEELWTSGFTYRASPQAASHPSPLQWVELTAHVDDPAADQCTRTYPSDYAGDRLDPSLVKLACREELVATNIQGLPFPPAPARSNGRIAFDAPGAAGGGARDVFSINPDGSDRQNLTPGSGAEERNVLWSPDGQRVAYISSDGGGSVLVSGPDFSAAKTVHSGSFPWGTYFTDGLAWSPYSNRLALAVVPGEVRIIDLDGNVQQSIPAANARYLAWSPSGAWLAYASGSDLMAVHTYTGETRLLADMDSNVRFPSWTPDEGRVLFIGYTASGNTDVFSVGIDASGLTNVTNSADRFEDEIYLSPDGQQMVAMDYGSASSAVVVMNVDGTDAHEVYSLSGQLGTAVWSPDGTQLAITHGDKLTVLTLDGGAIVELGAGSAPHWQALP
jgi:WD40 repeat protein